MHSLDRHQPCRGEFDQAFTLVACPRVQRDEPDFLVHINVPCRQRERWRATNPLLRQRHIVFDRISQYNSHCATRTCRIKIYCKTDQILWYRYYMSHHSTKLQSNPSPLILMKHHTQVYPDYFLPPLHPFPWGRLQYVLCFFQPFSWHSLEQ